MTATKPAARGTVFIKKAFQGRFILSVLMTLVLSGLLSALLVYLLIGSDLQSQSQAAHASIETLWSRLGSIIIIGNLAAALVAGVTAVIVVLYISHRIAGPLYRFETLCHQIGDGNLDAIVSLRDKDQLKDLAESFANMVEKLRLKRTRRLDIAAAMEARLEQLGAQPGLDEELREAMGSLNGMLTELRKLDARSGV